MKKGLVLIVILLLIGMSVVPSTATIIQEKSIMPTNNGNTLYVGGSGPNNYTKIQDAINDSVDGDTVFVYDDSSPYYENLVVDTAINLIGENTYTTHIDGSILIRAEDVSVSSFTIQYDDGDVITCARERSTISNNIIYNHRDLLGGITLWHGEGHLIVNNTIFSDEGTAASIFCLGGKDLVITKNNIISTSEIWEICEIQFSDADNVIFTNNTLISESDVKDALEFESSVSNSIIAGNIIIGYGIGLNIFRGNDNEILQNNFIGNRRNVLINLLSIRNTWYRNYWDDYTGEDSDGDGIGDTPYVINNFNKDNYPLMEPYGGYIPDAPTAPDIDGPHNVEPGVKYDYTFVAIDPNGDDVYYYITWGDGNYEDWIGPYASGEMITLNHYWYKKDNYAIIARAKDTNELIGPWETFTVTMPRNRATDNMLLLGLLEQFPLIQRLLKL